MLKKITSRIPHHRKALIYISFSALLWSTSGFFIKFLSINAFQISFYRSSIAAATVLVISLLRKQKLTFNTDITSILGSIFYAGILVLFVVATKLTTAANAIFLQFTAPIYLLVLEPVFLKTKFENKNLITIIICIVGMFLFFFGKLEPGDIYGNIFAIMSGICFALFTLILKWKKQKKEAENTLYSVIVGNALVSFICFFIVYPHFSINLTETFSLLYMGIFQIGISYIIFNEGIKYVSATESLIIATMEAIFNPIWVFLGIGEVPSIYSIAGGLIIMTAILWRNLSGRTEKKVLHVE
ncbi:MAG: DMT family transporter [Ignavibacteria bacterium]